jgi:hypothetical protein
MQNNSVLTVSSPFRFKTLFTKPLKYVIQLFTADATEHAATYSKGLVMNMSGKGFEQIPFKNWMEEYAINGAKIHIYESPKEFEKWQENKMEWFDIGCLGLEYDAIYAAYSALDEIKQIRNLDYKSKGQFCSQQAFDRLVAAEYFVKGDDTVSPAELKKKLLKAGWKKWRIN